jgi:lipopolysaccharide/colanic/teichoic acid biosynthesis glycosyltransferase
MRRAIDIAGACLLLLLMGPLLVLGAALVLLASGRPVFFGHLRVGRNGRPFRCWKLRTMRPDAQAMLDRDPALRDRYIRNDFKLPLQEDPRITPVGRFLRRWHLDELPQLINVLNGTMSLVGPRPIVREELAQYGAGAAELLTARPGIVGAWTSHGRKRPGYPERVAVELEYVRSATARRDLAILVRSIPVVLRGQDEG